MLALIAGAVDDRSARGIAAAVSRLVTAGTLPAGARLPTVRDVARELGVSPTTVSEAWRSLARAGAIQTRGPLRHVRRSTPPGPASACATRSSERAGDGVRSGLLDRRARPRPAARPHRGPARGSATPG